MGGGYPWASPITGQGGKTSKCASEMAKQKPRHNLWTGRRKASLCTLRGDVPGLKSLGGEGVHASLGAEDIILEL